MLAKARTQTPLKAARDAALVRLMFDLGLRRGEVTGLDLEDLEAKERRLWIRGKGRAQKEVRTLPEPTLAALTAWIGVRDRITRSGENAMFVGLAGGCAVSASPVAACITSLSSSVPPSASRHGLTGFGMPALQPRLMPTMATCGPCSCMPATPTRKPPCVMTTTGKTSPVAWLLT